MEQRTTLVTGAAGFIGFHTSRRLLDQGETVIGIDNLNDYYDPELKQKRLKILQQYPAFSFEQLDVSDREGVNTLFEKESIDRVCHLAAQAGVRYSLEDPFAYERSNSLGTLTILEAMRHNDVKDIVFASSSSVYGGVKEIPFKEDVKIDKTISLYAATKAACELQAHTYHHLFGINAIGLRFFTVYGPWGRPDMALFLFTKAMLERKPINVFNNGDMVRDFTYIDDIVDGVVACLENVNLLGYEILNLGCSSPVPLMDCIQELETVLGITAEKNMMPMQPGDIRETFADVSKAKRLVGYEPSVQLSEGIREFVKWYTNEYA